MRDYLVPVLATAVMAVGLMIGAHDIIASHQRIADLPSCYDAKEVPCIMWQGPVALYGRVYTAASPARDRTIDIDDETSVCVYVWSTGHLAQDITQTRSDCPPTLFDEAK
jgi:hypothetical protein